LPGEEKTMSDRIYYSREAEIQARREQITMITLFLALGLGIGALLALLFAPGSGEQTRQGLTSTLEDRFDTSREATRKTIHRLEKEFNELRDRVEDRLGR
jgi:gas vesicle protein